MKKNFKLIPFAVLTIAAIASCSEINPETPAKDYFYNDDPAAMTFSASTQATTPETKTSFAAGETKAEVNWVKGDAITVFDAENKNVEFTTEANGVTSGTFAETVTGSFTKSSDIDAVFYSVYPYSEENSIAVNEGNTELTVVVPDNQIVSHSTFAPKANVAVAKSDADGNLAFQNLCGYLRFVITKGDRIKSVTISGTNNEVIAGKVKVQWKDGEPKVTEIVDGKTSITFSLEDGSTFPSGKTYFVTLLPQTLSGIKIEMTTVEDVKTIGATSYTRTMNPVKTASSPMVIERNKILRLPFWDRLEWLSAMVLDMEDVEVGTTCGSSFGTGTDIYKGTLGSEKELYSVAANPNNTGINKSAKVLKFDGTSVAPTDYSESISTSTSIKNARLLVYLSDNYKARAVQKEFNAVRMKVYIPADYPEKHTPRLQWGYNKWGNNVDTGSGTVRNRPIFTPTYVNGVKLGDKYINFGTSSKNEELISKISNTKNIITENWLTSYGNAIKLGDWNDFIFLIGDVENANNKFLVNYSSVSSDVGYGTSSCYFRIHPFFPANPDNASAYHAEMDRYGVLYIDDIELIDF